MCVRRTRALLLLLLLLLVCSAQVYWVGDYDPQALTFDLPGAHGARSEQLLLGDCAPPPGQRVHGSAVDEVCG